MKVKVGNKVYDPNVEPVMIILTEQDKINISNMAPEATKYCVYPDNSIWPGNDYVKIKEWMKEI